MSSLDEYLSGALARLAADGLLRSREAAALTDGLINVSRNDYLGLAGRNVSRETKSPSGAGASRLIFGTNDAHVELEREVADWVGLEDAVVFSSGYAANLGCLTALARPGDLIVSDELNHASIVDGCRLSGAKVQVVRHCDAGAVEAAFDASQEQRRWVVSESYFSMDGDSPDLLGLRRICDKHGAALVVDEAHALGVFGPAGSGLCRAAGIRPDVFVGGFGKAVGAAGAFVAGSKVVTEYLWNRARSFVFSTGVSPALCEIILSNVRTVRADERGRARLAEHCSALATQLAGVPTGMNAGRHGPIFPIQFGRPERALSAASRLREAGFLAQAIRPPTVAEGTSRLRIALNADLSDCDVARLGATLRSLCLES